jgi:hypothetical protein
VPTRVVARGEVVDGTLLRRAIEKSVSPGCTIAILFDRVWADGADVEPVMIDPVSRSRLGSSLQPTKKRHTPMRSTVASITAMSGEEDAVGTERTT